jgi:aspartate/methionine/tyrosine aminotransferase
MLRPLSILPETVDAASASSASAHHVNSNDSSGHSERKLRRTRSSSISEAKERGGSMVTKLYEFALIGWNNHPLLHQQQYSTAVSAANGSGSRQRMAFIAENHRLGAMHQHQGGSVTVNRNGAVSSLRAFSTSSNQSSSSKSKLSSSRAQNAIALLPTYLLDARSVTKYHPISAPNGALQLSVAENQLSELPVCGVRSVVEQQQGVDGSGDDCGDGGEEMTLVQVLSQLASSNVPRPSDDTATSTSSSSLTFEKDMIYYQPTQGSPGLRSAMGKYLHDLLLSSSSSTSSTTATFNPENIILGAGCNAVLENLCMCLTEPGDAVMIPTPYYAAFEFDLVARAGCEIVSVNTLNYHDESPPTLSSSTSSNGKKRSTIPPSFYYPNKASLTNAYNLSIERTSRPPKVLLLSHPNNPLGICYPPHVVEECIEWCRENEVHLISDEIYAGSVYRQTRSGEDGGGEEDTFVSAMSLASNHKDNEEEGGTLGLGPYIHLVYALSKDFALSGLRVGVAYTENPEILVPMQKLNDLCQISSQTQLLVERMLSATVAGSDNKKFVDAYLSSNRNNIQTRCDKLQSCLSDVDIPYTPGMSMRNERPGFFRCVFTAASEEEFELGLERIRKFVAEERGSR